MSSPYAARHARLVGVADSPRLRAGGQLTGQTTPSARGPRARSTANTRWKRRCSDTGAWAARSTASAIRRCGRSTGETVRITIVNGELMVHDIALEKLDVKSAQILDKGASTSITFKANESDTYYCSLPGHRAAGMEGRLDVSDAPRVQSGRRAARGERTAAQSGFRDRHAGRTGRRPATRSRSSRPTTAAAGPAQTGSRARTGSAAASRGSARKGTLSSAPFRVTPSVRQLSRLRRRVRQHARRSWCSADDQRRSIYSISGTDQRAAAAGGRRPQRRTPARTSSSGWSTTRPARRRRPIIKESPWAHINFDNFRFHESKPFFLERDHAGGDHRRCRRWIPCRTPACRARRPRGR